MSRSYKKPWVVDGNGSRYKKFMKNYANRKIRRKNNAVPDGKYYRKITNPWEICDYRYPIDLKETWIKDKPWKYTMK